MNKNGSGGLICPKCGSRTHVYDSRLVDGVRIQRHRCTNKDCDFKGKSVSTLK